MTETAPPITRQQGDEEARGVQFVTKERDQWVITEKGRAGDEEDAMSTLCSHCAGARHTTCTALHIHWKSAK